ncbi:MAG: DMT family transporter [Chitinophagales bacterium]|nr:DMT family transporter [Bacteroidota bacterium]MBX7142267.1 DMT family transporter [Chitinophagales bacterium]
MSEKLRTHLYLFLANLIYALSFTVAKDVVPHYIKPFGAIVIRVTVAGALFIGYKLAMEKEKVERRDYGLLILCGLFGVAINQLLFFKGLSITTPINAALMMTTTPILVLLLSGIFHDEKITWLKIAGVICGAAGAVLVILSGKEITRGSGQTMGDIFVLLNATSYAIYLVIVKPLMKKYHPITVITWVFIFGWFFVLPVGWSEFSAISWHVFPRHIWLELSFIVIFTTFFAYLLNTLAMRYAAPSVVGIYIYLQPALATLIALLLNRDEYPLIKVVATALIFLGVYLVSMKNAFTFSALKERFIQPK